MSRVSFASVGDNCIDRYLPPVDDSLVGGNAVNVAVQLALLGREASYFGAVGSDRAGETIRGALHERGIDVTGLRLRRMAGEVTARTDIETLPDGDRRFVAEHFGACLTYRADAAELARFSHVHIGWLRGTRHLRGALSHGGAIISQDLSVNNLAEDLNPEGLDIAFSSAPPEQGEAESRRLVERGARIAVVTLGAAGSLANECGKIRRIPAVPVDVVDTTGAGDAFIAGFLDAFAKSLNLKDCLEAGAMSGAAACRHRGGFPQDPLQPFVHDMPV